MKRALFAALLMLLPALAEAQPNKLVASPPDQAVLANQYAQTFTDQFWLAWSSPNSVALPYVRSVVGDSLEFYGKPTSRADFMKVQTAFTNRWPERQYWIQPNSEQINCDYKTYSCTVTGIVNWKDFSQARNAASSGSAKFKFLLKGQMNHTNGPVTFLIAAESGSVIGSKTSAQSNFAALLLPAGTQAQNQLVTNTALQAAGCISKDGATMQHEDCESIEEIDLTKTFRTKEKFVFEVIQGAFDLRSEDPPLLNFCFVRQYGIQCQNALFGGGQASANWFGYSNSLLGTSIVYPVPHADYPVLLGQTIVAEGIGCGGIVNFVWAYDPAVSDFRLIWSRPNDCHTALKFETKGPLAGDMVAVDNDVTERWPWPYGIEVYKFLPPDHLEKLLYIVGRAGQGGKYVSGPEDAIGIDMPEILRHLPSTTDHGQHP